MTDFSVVAIVAAYNEADVISHVVGDLIEQGLQVYFLDDGSTDGTIAAVEPFAGRGLVGIERLAEPVGSGFSRTSIDPPEGGPHNPAGGATPSFDWERILRRKTELARELDADWFVHHDADEFRESPWSHVPLADAIRRVDALGFNAIDFASFDFWPVDDRFRPGADVREALRFYAEPAEYDRLQIRCWKKAPDVDLASTGGHEARFCGRKVFPIRFISRHYSIRSQAHGERKVFHERRNRFLERERAKGWHVQYDEIGEGASFIRETATLELYDADAIRLALALRHRGVEELERRLAAERSAIATLQREFDAREQDARRIADTLVHTTQRLAETEGTLAQTRATLADAQNALAQTRDALTRAEGTLGRTQDTLARAEGTLADRTAEAAVLRGALDERAIEIGQWRAAAEDCTRRLDAFERALSWRWTAPARAAIRLLRGY